MLVVCNQQNQTIDSRIIPLSLSIRNSLVMPSFIAYFRLLLCPPLSRFSRDFPLYPLPQSLQPLSLLPGCNQPFWSALGGFGGSPPCCTVGSCAVRASAAQPNSSAQHPLRPLQQQSPLLKPAKAPPLKPRAWRLIRGSAAPTAIHRHCLMACLVRFDPKPPLSLVCLAASGTQDTANKASVASR